MIEERTKRKLTAILSADVKGYSRLMGEDEKATVETLKAYRELMGEVIRQFGGRVVDSPGDNVLSEFASVVDAVECAVKIQEELKTRNEGLPENRRMEFRIGVHHGDVIEDEERIYGDGVNVAARIEGLAEGGGICISRTSFDSVKNKLNLGYEYLGDHSVKNITEPVRVYKVLMEPEHAGKVIGEERLRRKQWRWAAIGGIVVLILVAGVLAIWSFYFRPPFEPASTERMAFPLPDKPSIAVLPFVNMSADPEQGYLADGITENIISILSQVPKLFVIARNSTFTYKGKPVKVQKVAEELGVQYVLEGSIQRSGDNLRITAQLIDAITGHHLWSERYDRHLEDIFALQDEITLKILTALRVKLTDGERTSLKGTNNLEAYLKCLQGYHHFSLHTEEGIARARQLAKESIALDPGYAGAYTLLGRTHMLDVSYGWSKSRRESIDRALELAQKALALDDTHTAGRLLLSFIYREKGEYEKSIAEIERVIKLNPNSADAYAHLGGRLYAVGRGEEAIASAEKAIRLDPMAPWFYWYWLGMGHWVLGQYQEAIAAYKEALHRSPSALHPHVVLTASYSLLGREEEARAEAEEVLRLNPKFSVHNYAKGLTFKDEAYIERYVNALRKAGLPEHPPLPLPDKPSIAVLPFVNMSGDPKQEYFSDGITEEIITALSKSQRLFVIARESTFSYKGKSINIPTVGRELGVKYVLEGSVRMAEDQVRVTAQLIDATTAHHLWAERYDRDLKDIFAIQDEITLKILSSLQVKLIEGEQARMWAKKTKNLDVYLKLMEALSLWGKGTRESLVRFGQVGQEMVDMTPESVLGYRVLAWYYWGLATFGGKPPQENIARSFKLAQKALSLDESDADSHALLGSVYLLMRQYEKAIAEGERSTELNPNGAMVHGLLGVTLSFADRPDEALDHLKQAIRLNPFPASWYFQCLGRCYRQKGQYEEALTEFKKALHRAPDAEINHMSLAVIYILLDRQEEARAAAKKVLELNPNFSVETVSKAMPYKNEADLKLVVDALRKAGLK